ncbi:MAG: hypothetical protein RRY42_07930 [Mucinivorans sp.]
MLRQYFISTMTKNQDGYCLSSRTATGTLICVKAQSCFRPIRVTASPSIVFLSIPENEATKPLRGKFLYITARDELVINYMLFREFNLVFFEFMTAGSSQSIRRKDLIEMFITKYGLEDIPSAFDTLAKKHYRANAYALRDFRKKLDKMALRGRVPGAKRRKRAF